MTVNQAAEELRDKGGIPCEGVLMEPMPGGRFKITVYGVEKDDAWRLQNLIHHGKNEKL